MDDHKRKRAIQLTGRSLREGGYRELTPTPARSDGADIAAVVDKMYDSDDGLSEVRSRSR